MRNPFYLLFERLLFDVGDKIVRIKGWNSFLVDDRSGGRKTLWPCWDWRRVKDVAKRVFTGQPKEIEPPLPIVCDVYSFCCVCGQRNCTAGHGGNW